MKCELGKAKDRERKDVTTQRWCSSNNYMHAMKIKDIMTKDVIVTVKPEATVQEAAVYMKAADVGAVPVTEDKRPVGMLTDRDITLMVTAAAQDPRTVRVREVMTPDVIACHEDEEVEEAVLLMEEKEVRRLMVLNPAGELVGIVSVGDLARHLRNKELTGEVLQEIARPLKEDPPAEFAERRMLQKTWFQPERRLTDFSYR